MNERACFRIRLAVATGENNGRARDVQHALPSMPSATVHEYPPPRCKGGFQPQETLSKSLPPVDKGLKVGTGGAYLDQVALDRTFSTLAYKGEAPKPEPEAYMNTN